MRHHARTTAPGTLTRAAKTALSSTDLLGLKIWWSYDVTRSHTRRLGICLATTRLLRAEEFMLMSSGDVITPSQQPCKHLHISPSPRQRHVIG